MKILFIAFFLLPFQLFAQGFLSELEDETNNCVERLIGIYECSWDSIQDCFENYLIQSGIHKKGESAEQAYINYLEWRATNHVMPIMRGRDEFKELLKKCRVIAGNNRVGYPLARCFPLQSKLEQYLPEDCAFVSICKIFSNYSNLYEINPALLVPELKKALSVKVLEKPLYKKVLILCLFPDAIYLDEIKSGEVSEENPYKNSKRDIEAEEPSEDEIYMIIENMPQFRGGESGLRKFIASNLRYPKEAKEKGITGRVFVKFCVTRTG